MQGEIGSIFGIVKEVDVSARLRVKIKGLSVSRFEDEVRLKGGILSVQLGRLELGR